MAAKKKQSSQNPRTPAALQVNSSDAKIAKTPISKKPKLTKSTELAQKANGNSVVLLENGLVSLEVTPQHLVHM